MISSNRQKGLSLVVALIMLLVMTVTTIAVFQMSQTGTQVVGNMQWRDDALTVADSAIDEAVSTTRLFESPDALFLEQCKGSFNNRCYDLNGDGENEMAVRIDPVPTCVQVTVVPTSTLNLAVAGDLACARDTPQQFGVEGVSTGDSLCARSTWEVRAHAEDFDADPDDPAAGTTGARMTVVAGVGVLVPSGTALALCTGS